MPEIYEGIVKIVGVAREPGSRSKIAVTTRDADVDPVGACVGMKGSRVQAVVQELRGEKIDIVPFDRDPARYIIAAIQPAEVNKVIVDEADHRMELVVPDEKLSLAIGRKGQNVRLASQLTGWKLDIISESEAEDESRRARLSLSAIPGVGDVTAELLFQHGFKSAEEVAQAGEAALAEVDGIPEEKIPGVLAAARSHVEQLQREAAAAAAAAAAEAAARLEENTETFDDVEAATEPLAAEPREPEERS